MTPVPEPAAESKGRVGRSVFISYASDDKAFAHELCSRLEGLGISCWIAPRDVRPGQEYAEEIIRGIEAASCLVVVLSQSANDSKFVRAEVERAYSKGHPVFPVRAANILPSRALELFISTKHWIDAWDGDLGRHASKLAEQLLLDADLDLIAAPRIRRRVLLKRVVRFGSLGAGALLIALIVAFTMRAGTPPAVQEIASARPEPMVHATEPAKAFFMGGMVGSGQPTDVSYMLIDGWDGSGKVLDALNAVTAFEVYEVVSAAAPKRLLASDPAQFAKHFRSTPTYSFKIDALPKKVVSCLAYRVPSTGRDETVLQGFSFGVPASQFASFPATESAPPRRTGGAKAGCAPLVADYATDELKIPVAKP